MNGIEKLRQQYPQYEDIDDASLSRAVHRKVYGDMPFREYADKLGLDPSVRGLTAPEAEQWLAETLKGSGAKTVQDLPIEGRNAILEVLNNYRAGVKTDHPLIAAQAVTGTEIARMEGEALAEGNRGNKGILERTSQIGQGQTLGFMDEIAGGVQGVVEGGAAALKGENPIQGAKEGYARAQGFGNRQAANYREDNPWESVGLELAGALSTAGLGYAAAPNAIRATAASRPLVTASIAGSTTGAVQGAGTAEEGERGQGAVTGGVVGAVAGPLLQKTFGVLTGAAKRILSGSDDDVSKTIQKAAKRMDVDASKIDELGSAGPDTFMAEALGGDAKSVAAGVAGAGGKAQDFAEDAVTLRAEGRARRVSDAVSSKTGQARSVDAIEATAEARKQAGPMFDAARDATVEMSGKLKSLLRRANRAGVSFKKADEIAARDGDIRVNLSAYADDFDNLPDTASLQDVWAMARALESEAGRLARSGENGWRGLNNTAREMRDILKKASPDFAKGSKIWASSARDEQALGLGEKLFKQGGQVEADLKAMISGGMSQSEKVNFLSGMRQAIYQKTSNAAEVGGNQAARLKSGFVRDRMRLVFGDDAAKEIIKVLDAEDGMAAFENTVNRSVGSQTGARIEGRDALDRVTSGSTKAAMAGVVRNAKRQLLDEPRNKLAKFITQAGEDELLELAEALYGPASKSSPLARELKRLSGAGGKSAQGSQVAAAASSPALADRVSDQASR